MYAFLAYTLRASFGRPNPLLADLWGQSKNTRRLADGAGSFRIFTLTPNIDLRIEMLQQQPCNDQH